MIRIIRLPGIEQDCSLLGRGAARRMVVLDAPAALQVARHHLRPGEELQEALRWPRLRSESQKFVGVSRSPSSVSSWRGRTGWRGTSGSLSVNMATQSGKAAGGGEAGVDLEALCTYYSINPGTFDNESWSYRDLQACGCDPLDT